MSKISLVTIVALLVSLTGCGLFKKRQPISINQDGTIQQGDQVLAQDNSLYDDYPIDVDSGWVIHAVMTSDKFDSYLHVMDPAGNRVAQNDDDATLGGTGRNSQVTYTTTQAGIYHIYANSYQAGETGQYHITITAGPAGAIPQIPIIPLPAPAAPTAAPAAPAAPAPIAPAPN